MNIRLQIVAGPERGRSFHFGRADRFIAGSAAGIQLQLRSDPAVSAYHFLIEVNPPNLRLQDLGSSSGTFLNDSAAPVTAAELNPGDRIRVGSTVLTVSVEEDLAYAQTMPEAHASKSPVRCHRCGAPAEGEQPRAPEEDVVYYCGGCQSDLLGDPRVPSGYQLVRELGRGGMGAIYLVRSQALGELRAMKVMLPHVAMAAANRQLFLREARKHGLLSHPNVVLLYDTHELEPGIFCMIMEYVEGGSAADHLQRRGGRGLSPADAVAIVAQGLAGLSHAHERGLVHRDVKEANLLLTSAADGQVVKLADFGLARSFEEAGATSLTFTATVAGTLGYMAPEQITDFRNVSPRADVYSMGATLYSLLTGELPYDFARQSDPVQNMLRVLEEPIVPLRQRRPDVGEALALAVDRSLERDPQHRFASALEMQAAILAAV
jgi:hypothetical protein